MSQASGGVILPSRMRGAGIAVYAWILWILLVTSLTDGSWSGAGIYLVSTVAGVIGFSIARREPGLPATAEFSAGLLGISAYVLLSTIFRGGPGGGPLGYTNANAALAIQLLVITVICVLSSTETRTRVMAVSTCVMLVVTVAATSSRAGLAITALLLVSLVGLGRAPRPSLGLVRVWSAVWATLVGLGLGTILLAAIRHLHGQSLGVFDGARYTLWSDALTLWSRHWVRGAGPGGFVEFSNLAKDPDTARSHMSVLQVGAELGTIGVMLLFALVATLFVMLTATRTRASLVVMAGLAGLLLHSFVDHVLDFPVVLLAAGLALGWGVRPGSLEQLNVAERKRPG